MITYCTNIHPGERWHEVLSALQTHTLTVKKQVSPDAPFPIGLRLSGDAAASIDARAAQVFRDWCIRNACFVPTINGFPYGRFHAGPVKRSVYLPDWRDRNRVEYTLRLADLLGTWLPEGMTGSISTVPLGFKGVVHEDDLPVMKRNLVEVLGRLRRIREELGRSIVLSLEPEPGCVLETTAESAAFIRSLDLPDVLRDHLGVCLDCCHQAVQYENPWESFQILKREGIPVPKVQVSSALRLIGPDRNALEPFLDPVYLHQVVVRQPDSRMRRYDDLPDAIADLRDTADEEWRIHYHLPVWLESSEGFGTTRSLLPELLRQIGADVLLEVETYTWSVLPAALREATVAESLIREIGWVQEQTHEANRCH